MNSPNPTWALGREFWLGLTRPSLTALWIALSVPLISFIAFSVLVTPSALAGSMGPYLLSDAFDRRARVTSMVLGMKADERPLVVILGASLTMLIVNEELLSDALEERTGVRPRVLHLATGGQHTWEMVALLDRIPPGSQVVVVFGLSKGALSLGVDEGPFTSLSATLQSPRLGFRSDEFDAEVRLAGLTRRKRTGIYAIDNLDFLLSRRKAIAHHLVFGPPEYGDPLDAPWVVADYTPEFWQEEIQRLPQEVAYYRRNRDMNFAILRRAADRLRSRAEASFVVLEPPVNPAWFETQFGPEFFPEYRADLGAFAASNGMAFVSVTDAAKLEVADFVDYEGHIGNDAARDRTSEVIADAVAGLGSLR